MGLTGENERREDTPVPSSMWMPVRTGPVSVIASAARIPQQLGVTGSPPLAWRGLLALGLPFTVASSPPHTWGGRLNTRARTTCDRFTPTRVGTFPSRLPARAWLPVHPHTRGDIAFEEDSPFWVAGSPPHAWGHCIQGVERGHLLRFTPTRVGTFSSSRSRPRR